MFSGTPASHRRTEQAEAGCPRASVKTGTDSTARQGLDRGSPTLRGTERRPPQDRPAYHGRPPPTRRPQLPWRRQRRQGDRSRQQAGRALRRTSPAAPRRCPGAGHHHRTSAATLRWHRAAPAAEHGRLRPGHSNPPAPGRRRRCRQSPVPPAHRSTIKDSLHQRPAYEILHLSGDGRSGPGTLRGRASLRVIRSLAPVQPEASGIMSATKPVQMYARPGEHDSVRSVEPSRA